MISRKKTVRRYFNISVLGGFRFRWLQELDSKICQIVRIRRMMSQFPIILSSRKFFKTNFMLRLSTFSIFALTKDTFHPVYVVKWARAREHSAQWVIFFFPLLICKGIEFHKTDFNINEALQMATVHPTRNFATFDGKITTSIK